MFEFLHRWWSGTSHKRHTATKVPANQYRPQLEILEDRSAAAVLNLSGMAGLVEPLAAVLTPRSATESFQAPSPTAPVSAWLPFSSADLPGSIRLTAPFFDGWLGEIDLPGEEAALVFLHLGVAVGAPNPAEFPNLGNI